MKRRKVGFDEQALRDLDAIYDWICEQGSHSVAASFVERLQRYCLGFDLASERGIKIDPRRPDLRAVGFNRQATVVFAVGEDEVAILRVYRAGLDWTAGLPQDD